MSMLSAVTSGLGPGGDQLPSAVLTSLDLFIRVHKLWYWKNLYDDVTRSKEDLMAFGASYGFSKGIGSQLFDITTGPTYLLASRILFTTVWYRKCIAQYITTVNAYHHFLETCRGEKILHVRSSDYIVPQKKWIHIIIDPATLHAIGLKFRLLFIRIEQMAKMAFHFLKEAFNLCNCIVTLGETLSLSPYTNEHAKDLCLFNAWKIMGDFSIDPEKIKETLEDYKKTSLELNEKVPFFGVEPKKVVVAFNGLIELVDKYKSVKGTVEKVTTVAVKAITPVSKIPVVSQALGIFGYVWDTAKQITSYAKSYVDEKIDYLARDLKKKISYDDLEPMKEALPVIQPRPQPPAPTSLRDVQTRALTVMYDHKWRIPTEHRPPSLRITRPVTRLSLAANGVRSNIL